MSKERYQNTSITVERTGLDPDREHQTYLRVAEDVLAEASSSLRAREIVDRGIDRGLFGDHPLSLTPEKSMQARLSMDILNRGSNSKFARTGRGQFTLRSKIDSLNTSKQLVPGSNDESKNQQFPEYTAKPRVLRTPSEKVLCVSEPYFEKVLTFQGIDTDAMPIFKELLVDASIQYIARSEAESRNDAKQFITYVLVQCGQYLLCFERSYLSRSAEFLRGSKCIGFGGHVSEADNGMFSSDDCGLSTCARRELMEELSLPLSNGKISSSGTHALPQSINPSTVQLFQNAPLELLGILNDDSSEVGRRHVAVVYRIWLPDWEVARFLRKGDSSIKGLGWIDVSEDEVAITEFEYWSQLCLRKFYPSTAVSKPRFKYRHKSGKYGDKNIVVAGHIGSGKTLTATHLSQYLRVPLINSGEVLQNLMGSPPIGEIGREEFQIRANKFIHGNGGPEKLADNISDEIRRHDEPRCIIDGIRHPSTYERLSCNLNRMITLLFVQTPPDVSYEMYRLREAKDELNFTFRKFTKIYDALSEREIQSLGRNAEMYIYNEFGMDSFRRTLEEISRHLSA